MASISHQSLTHYYFHLPQSPSSSVFLHPSHIHHIRASIYHSHRLSITVLTPSKSSSITASVYHSLRPDQPTSVCQSVYKDPSLPHRLHRESIHHSHHLSITVSTPPSQPPSRSHNHSSHHNHDPPQSACVYCSIHHKPITVSIYTSQVLLIHHGPNPHHIPFLSFTLFLHPSFSIYSLESAH